MRKWIPFTLIMMFALCAAAATKEKGKVPLKDVQPAGVTDKKHKHQQYDLSFISTAGKNYTCRTPENASVKATDLVVGSSISYEVNGNKGKIKTEAGKNVDCTIVRVSDASSAPK
jgi:hypothetical protein